MSKADIERCPFCNTDQLWEGDKIIHTGEYSFLILSGAKEIEGSMFIVTKDHKITPFDFTNDEILDINNMLKKAKTYLEENLKCDGYNIGWNVGEIGGQNLDHAHLHILPRFKNEPFAGKGIRHWFKSKENQRSAKKT